jgi:hypothetical protein
VLLKKEIFNTQRIIRALPPLLFDNNKEALTNIHESLMAQNRHGDIEKMDCALSASWEADIIILSGFVLMMQLLLKKE